MNWGSAAQGSPEGGTPRVPIELPEVRNEDWKAVVLADTARVAEGMQQGSGDGYLYRPDELLVASDKLDAVRDSLKDEITFIVDPAELFYDRGNDPGVGVRLIKGIRGRGVLQLLKELREGFGRESVQLNHILSGLHGNHHNGPMTYPIPANPPAHLRGRSRADGVVVGVLDSGVVAADDAVSHDFLASRSNLCTAGSVDLPYGEYGEAAEMGYESGHGTFVAGVILQMAPGARLVASRVLNSDGLTDDWTVAKALLDLVRREPRMDLVNLSLGGITRDDEEPLALKRALELLKGKVVVVAAAGNVLQTHEYQYDYPSHFWPAAADDVISVGGMEADGPVPLNRPQLLTKARFNDLSEKSEFAAVADWVSTFGAGTGWSSVHGQFDGWARWVGTSFAAAAVTGALATLLGRDPSWSGNKQAAVDALAAALSGSEFPEVCAVTGGEPVPRNVPETTDENALEPSASALVEALPSSHGIPVRGMDTAGVTTAFNGSPGSPYAKRSSKASTGSGRFERMFPDAPVAKQSEKSLVELAEAMTAVDHPEDAINLPAGYAFFGQFVGHDLTYDPATVRQREADPDAVANYRTPRLDLDSLYGRGPEDQPYLYRVSRGTDPGEPSTNAEEFLLGTADDRGIDLPRNPEQRAIVVDPRNDQNLVISQLAAVFLKFHNRVAAKASDPSSKLPVSLETPFQTAQRLVRWHYQKIVVDDYLPKIAGSAVVDDILRRQKVRDPMDSTKDRVEVRPSFLHFRTGAEPFIPVEFALAAYRFGHSLIRSEYSLNALSKDIPMFHSDGNDEHGTDKLLDLRGYRSRPAGGQVDWALFFDGIRDGETAQRCLRVDTHLANPLASLPGEIKLQASLAARTLIRGADRVPSGQAVAAAMGLEPIAPDQLGLPETVAAELGRNTPLWYYLLKEAELPENAGEHLGEMGGRIVAEVILGILLADDSSYLSSYPGWTSPFGISDIAGLIKFSQDGATDGEPE